MESKQRVPADFIVPLSINGLEGRVLHLPASPQAVKKREILFIYGQHSLLERWWGLVEVMSDFGNVTMPDLPGFGGMDSFYKINQKPTIDNMADYLATFIKWRYKRKKLVIAGGSYGFVVTTRMLQRYPDLIKKVELLASFVGFAHHDDFLYSPGRKRTYRLVTSLLYRKPVAWILQNVVYNRHLLQQAYKRTYSGKHKFAAIEANALQATIDIEIKLWQANDAKTHWFSAHEFLSLDNTKKHIDLPVWHIATVNDHFFNNTVVEQHYRAIFSDFHGISIDVPNHAPSVIDDAEMAAPFLPEEVRQVLRDLP